MIETRNTVVTVTGEIPADQLGITLAHEHLWCDISLHSGKPDNVLTNVELMSDELRWFRAAGGSSIVEMTCEGIGRDPEKLAAISQSSGVQIISGIALYDASTYPDWVRNGDINRIADYFVEQIEVGINGVTAGVIGELMSHNEPVPNPSGYRLHELEARVFRAAAKAQRITGIAISTHAALGRGGHAQLDVLEEAGADLRKVAIGHCDAHWHEDERIDLQYYLPILERGAYCSFDMIGWTELAPDSIRARRIAALIGLGYEDQLLLSTDTCRLSQLKAHGGRGFDYLQTSFLPQLSAAGVTDSQIDSMLRVAPRRLFSK